MKSAFFNVLVLVLVFFGAGALAIAFLDQTYLGALFIACGVLFATILPACSCTK